MTAAPNFVATSLEELSTRSFAELEQMYLQAPLPESVLVLNGRPKGKMLAVRYLDNGLPHSLIAAFARLGVFPWNGKSFDASTEYAGQGANRIKLIFPQLKLFTFYTRIQPSAIDGRPCILLDYDQPTNPWFIRRIRDELREVANGLFLGPAMARLKDGQAETVLWFGIDTNQQCD